MDYESFIAGKHRRAKSCGIQVDESRLNKYAFPFQRAVVQWACEKGRAAIFADCGLGKSLMSLDWLEQMIPACKLNRGLLLTPVAVGPQMIDEAEKFGIATPIKLVASQSDCIDGINVTNYEKLHKFDTRSFGAVVLDESSILKSFAGKTKRTLCESFKDTQYKLSTTATPSPNDHMELGNQADFLGVMPSNEMLSRWFLNDTMKAGGYRLKGHAKADFWRWVASWAMVIRKPSDIGFDGSGYELPPMKLISHTVESGVQVGRLFATPEDVTATSVHKEKKSSLPERCKLIAGLVNKSDELWSVWCDTNYEADAFKAAIPDAVEVRGSESDKDKAEKLQAFTKGKARVIITKPEIGGFGLNWQHCHNTIYPAGFSFERWYQSVRRHLRFGQKNTVNVHLISSQNEANVVRVLQEKQRRADEMAAEMVAAMREEMESEIRGSKLLLNKYQPKQQINIPKWLTSKGGVA